jgi:hypothetical protein
MDLTDDRLVLAFGHEQSMLARQYCSTMGGPWRSTWHDGGDFYGMPPSSSNLRFGSVSLERVWSPGPFDDILEAYELLYRTEREHRG